MAHKTPFFADMHTHSNNSHDCVCPLDDMCRAQIAAGTAAFAVTDHYDSSYTKHRDYSGMIKGSMRDVDVCRERYGDKIEILKGIEIGESYINPACAAEGAALDDFDVIIGSVHVARCEGYDTAYSQFDFSAMPIEDIYRFLGCYFDDMLEMLEPGVLDFDILAHLTCPLRYINGKYSVGADISRYEQKIRLILERVISRGISLEVNTSGLVLKNSILMPDEHILRTYREMGGRLLTLASDAHVPQNAASRFDETTKLLSALGFSELCIYRKRKIYTYGI